MADIKQSPIKNALIRAGIVASFMVGPAEIALSDALFARVGIYANKVSVKSIDSSWAQVFFSKGSLLAFIYLESFVIGLAMLNNKQLRGAYAGYEAYKEGKRKHQDKLHIIISAAINSPYKVLYSIGVKIENLGSALTKNRSKISKWIGNLVVDIGKTNTMSTTGVVLTELGEKQSQVNLRRVSRLSLIFALCWLPVFIGVQFGYRALGKAGVVGGFFQQNLGVIGHGLDVATTVNITHPLQTPIGTACILIVISLLAVTGWRVANYLEYLQK